MASLLVPSPPHLYELSGPRRRGYGCFPFRIQKLSCRGVRVRVCSGVKDLEEEPKVLNLENDVMIRLYGQFSAQVKPPPSTASSSSKSKAEEEEEEEMHNFHLNTGYAIRTIRDEFPELFSRELTFNIYRDDVVFKDPLNTFVGIENYKSIFWALRFHGKIFFRALWVDIVSVWQPVENVVMVRWTVHGIPRIPWESRGRFDGTSEYKLDKNGKIYEHQVHNIALNTPPKFRILAVHELLQSIGCSSTPKPTYFESSLSTIRNAFSFATLMEFRHFIKTHLPLPGLQTESSQR